MFELKTASITYIYDPLGRLVGVVDAATNEASIYQYDATGNLLAIVRQSAAVVSIIDFSPPNGPVGTTVTISGTGFSATPAENAVAFDGVAATVTSATATQLVATVPAGASTGAIGVTAPGGSATSSRAFTVDSAVGAPIISSFAPTVADAGATVGITGVNFDAVPANNTLRVNGRYLPVTASTTSSLSARVPTATGSGRFVLKTPGGTTTSADDFFIPPPPSLAANVQVTGRMTTNGELKTVTLTAAGKLALVVFEATAGQGLTLRLTNVSIASGTVGVYSPTLGYVGGTSLASGGVVNFVPTVTGTHSIAVVPAGSATGSATLSFSTADVTVTAFTAPSAVATQQSISVSWTVTNQGTAAANGLWGYDSLYLTPSAACCAGATLIASYFNAASLGPGASYTQTKTVAVPQVPGGSYSFFIVTNATGSLFEATSSNNQRSLPVFLGVPDVTPTAFAAPSAASTQQPITLTWTTANQGTGTTAPTWLDYVYLSSSATCCTGATLLALATSSPLAPGSSYSRSVTISLPQVAAGAYHLFLVTDSAGNLFESDETNNQRTLPLTLGVPDLTPTAFTAPAAVSTQQAVSVSWTVNNQGSGATAVGWIDKVVISPNATCCGGATTLGTYSPPAVAAGASYTQTKTVTIPNLAAGAYTLFVIVDALTGLYETDEANNQRSTPVSVGVPDLAATALSAPSSTAKNQSISVSWTVANQGSGATAAAWVDFVWITPSATCCSGATLIGTFNPAAVPAGGSYTPTQSMWVPNLAAGSYNLFVITDYYNGLYETDESNNSRSVPIAITP